MKIIYLKELPSTQIYLKEELQKENIELPFAVSADIQTNGVGSRDNEWTGLKGNLFLSFAISLDKLPQDLKLESASIYFSYLLKDVLESFGSKVWLKWPNDFFIDDTKIGGMITNIVGNTLICGVGINLVNAPENFATLDVKISKKILLEKYFKFIEKSFSWKEIFSKYKLEFVKSKKFYTHKNKIRFSLDRATLLEDGSILVDNERIYSLR